MHSYDEIKTVCVVGAGTMGHGIAQVFAVNGYSVSMVDVSKEVLEKALERIKWSLGKLVEKGMVKKEDADLALSRITTYVGDVGEAAKNADFIIEAVFENLDVKKRVFEEVDSAAPPHAIIATNTSGLPITLMAEAASRGRREKVVGMHWFNPPQLMRLIEVIRCKYTSEETVNTTFKLAQKLGKEPIIVNGDINGFVANRVYRAIRYEAFAMFLRREAEPIEIDSAFRYKLGAPMGPFELADFTGAVEIEISAAVEETRKKCPEWEPHEEYFELYKYAMKLSKERYEKGLIGVKTGKGFYDYPKPGQWARPNIPKEAGERIDPVRILAPAINLAAWLIERGVATASDIDKALKLGFNFPKGVLEVADEVGLDVVVNILNEKADRYKGESYATFYKPRPLLVKLVSEGKVGKRVGEGFYKY